MVQEPVSQCVKNLPIKARLLPEKVEWQFSYLDKGIEMQFSSIDLHCHSTHSDGELCPEALVQRAAEKGVKVLSLTDHDTITGIDEAIMAADNVGIKIVPGIELSCEWRGYGIHILGLNFSMERREIMLEAQESQADARVRRAKEIASRLMKKGLPDVFEDASSLASNAVPGRPHFARALMATGAVSSESEAFKKYLGAGKAGDVKSMWPELQQVVSWIIASGGSAVIAHPRKYNMTLTRLRELIVDFKSFGGDGMEVIVSAQKQGEIGMLSDLCGRFELSASLGSDFHSPRFPWIELGRIPCLPKSLTPVWDSWQNITWDC